ncbi:MAG: rRNA maturation RNase YbeY [bacterium]
MSNPKIAISWENGAPPAELDEGELRRALSLFVSGLGRGEAEISLLMAGDATLAGLNERFRGVAAATDILCWNYRATDAGPAPDGPALEGELALSLARARSQARANGWDLRTEVLRLLAHGCAHLAGYDHQTASGEQEMRAVEIALLAKTGLRNLYPG